MNKVIDIENIKLVSLNKKFTKNFSTGYLILSKEYKLFQKELYYNCKYMKAKKPYSVKIEFDTHLDIDNCIKPVLDVLQKRKIIEDDKYIEELYVFKNSVKRNVKNKIQVWVNGI